MYFSDCSKKILVSLSVSLTLVTLGLASGTTSMQCRAQGPSMYTGAKTVKEMQATNLPRVPAKSRQVNDMFSKPERLPKEKAVFEDIPQYPGKAVYTSGMVYQQNDGKGSNFSLVTYSATEPKSQVKDWYANALRMYGWTISFQSDTVINARNNKTGNYCNLQFCDSTSPKERSTFQIDYHRTNK